MVGLGLRNGTILDVVVNHESIPQIWWNGSIPQDLNPFHPTNQIKK
jgi:hypothetical protein